jgi:hypothetical protein
VCIIAGRLVVSRGTSVDMSAPGSRARGGAGAVISHPIGQEVREAVGLQVQHLPHLGTFAATIDENRDHVAGFAGVAPDQHARHRRNAQGQMVSAAGPPAACSSGVMRAGDMAAGPRPTGLWST